MSPWIKIEHSTPDKPEIVTIAAQLGIDPDAVVGKLIRVWCWADQNCVKGNNIRVTSAFLDRITYQPGFAAAMRDAGWLTGEDGSLAFTGFDRHNGTSAKARAETNRRVAKHRNGKSVSVETIKVLPKPLPEEEEEEDKERESTPATPASELNLQADAIAATYCRQDSPLEVRQLILDDLLLGTPPAELREGVSRCMQHIRRAPQGSANRFVPKALSFFSERQWRSPESFQERWSKDAPPMPSRRQTDEIPTTATAKTLQKL
jgi:hypothetical protein